MATPSLGLGASYGRIRNLSLDQHQNSFTVAGEGFRVLALADRRTREVFHADFDRVGPIDICESVEVSPRWATRRIIPLSLGRQHLVRGACQAGRGAHGMGALGQTVSHFGRFP